MSAGLSYEAWTSMMQQWLRDAYGLDVDDVEAPWARWYEEHYTPAEMFEEIEEWL